MIGIHTKLTHETPKTAFLTHRCAIGAAELPCIPGRKRHRTIEAPDPNHAITKLPHLTIKRLTKLFTLSIINDKRPNCETNWPLAIGRTIPFEIIWPTLGTPLSDATEEKELAQDAPPSHLC